MSSLFTKFETFGAIADFVKRERLAKAIYEQLTNITEKSIGFANVDTDNFAIAVDQILSNSTMKELCSNDSELATKITLDILDFINNTKKEIIKKEYPFEKESLLLNECLEIRKTEFINYFEGLSCYLQDNYKKDKLNIQFYREQFKSCFFEDEWLEQLNDQEDEKDFELNLINKFEKIKAKERDFFPSWKEALNFIAKTYKRRDIDCNDYFSKFHETLSQNKDSKNETFTSVKDIFISNWKQVREKRIVKEEKERNQNHKNCIELKTNIEKSQNEKFLIIKEHFVENWEHLLKERQICWELDQIDNQRKIFCSELYKRIEELKKLQEVLEPFTSELGRLWDMTKGSWQRVNLDILKRYSELLQRDKSLKELVEVLGRMRLAEKEYEEELFSNIQLKSEWKVEHASKTDLIGIHESDDLSSLLPSETALLADETIQLVFFKKFVEKKLQTFEYSAKIPSYREEEIQDKRQKDKEGKKGPFIICVDTSGSMHGTPETVAKTLCFAILKLAIRDNRKCYLISFSTGIETLDLIDLKNSLDKIISFLSMSFHGGTDAIPAMREALGMLTTQDYKKADVIMVSDFVMSAFDLTTQNQIKLAKGNKTKFHSLIVGDSKNPAIIKDFDNNWVYDLKNPNSLMKLIKNFNTL